MSDSIGELVARLARTNVELWHEEDRARSTDDHAVASAKRAIDALHARGWHFYPFVGQTGVRLMCAWDTTGDVVDRFAGDLRTALASG